MTKNEFEAVQKAVLDAVDDAPKEVRRAVAAAMNGQRHLIDAPAPEVGK